MNHILTQEQEKLLREQIENTYREVWTCLLYTSPSPRD